MFLEVNENENMPFTTLGHSKGSPKKKFIAMRTYIKRTEISQINDLMLHLKLLEQQE
jgi:hypothetical protein